MMPAEMKRAQLIPQGSLNRILQEAEASWQTGNPQQAVEQFERASRLVPANCQILLRLGQIHGLSYNYPAAEQMFEKAIRLAPKKSEMLALAARHAVDFADHSIANLYYQKAIECPDAAPETFVRLAEHYEHLHRNEDAMRLVDRALDLNPAFPIAILARARLDRQARRWEDAERRVRSVPSTADHETRVRARYELGMILDGQKRYDEAMAAFLEGKAMQQAEAAPLFASFKEFRARLIQMQERVSPEMFQRWRDSLPSLQPSRSLALLCGHPRSGTTLLEQVLDSHPEIASIEETQIFTTYAYNPLLRRLPGRPLMLDVLESAPTDALRQSRESYFATAGLHLGPPVGNRLLIDKNPSLNFFIPAFVRIFPETKFLVALRDPRDVCLSCFMQPIIPLSPRSTSYLSLQGAVEEYAATMGIWRTLKPLVQSQGLEVRYEELVDNLEAASRRTLEFLGVAWDERVLQFDQHARGKRVRSPTYADVAKPVSKGAVGRWRNYEKYLQPHLKVLEPFLATFGYS